MRNARQRWFFATAILLMACALAWTWSALGDPIRQAPVVVDAPEPTIETPDGTTPGADPARETPDAPFTPPAAGIAGRVRTQLHRPVPRPALDFRIRVDGQETELGRTLGTMDGAYALDRPLAEWRGRGATLVVTIRASGFRPERETRVVDDLLARAADAALVVCDFIVDPGQALAGRAVDTDGRPVEGAELVLFAPSVRDGELVSVPAATATSAADGRFELGFTSEGVYALSVRAEGRGTARIEDLELGVGPDRDLGDLVLRGAGLLAGVAVHADGAPAPALELVIVPAEYAARPDAARVATAAHAGKEDGQGLAVARVTTDDEGRFEARGLALGRYAVVAGRRGVRIDSDTAVHALPARDVRVVVASARLCVRVVQQDGTIAVGARVACARLELASDGQPEPAATDWRAPRAPANLACFDVEPETTYALRVVSGESAVEDVVILAPGEFSLVKELVLPPPGRGALRIALATPAGRSPPRLFASLVSALTGDMVDECQDRELRPDGLLDGLPPGKFRLQLVPRGAEDAWLTVRVSEVLEIHPQSTLDHAVTLELGGTIELELAVDGAFPADFEYRVEPQKHPDDVAKARAAHEAARGALVTLVLADGPARAVAFEPRAVEATGPASLRGVASTLLPGRKSRLVGAWAPGEYTLRAVAEGFEPAEARFVLRPGETRSERVVLRAR